MLKYKLVLILTLLVSLSLSQSSDDCYPDGIKIGLGDNWDFSRNYDILQLQKSKNHDYTISYFVLKSCEMNHIVIEQDRNKFTFPPTITSQYDWQLVDRIKGKKDFSIFIQVYMLELKDLKFKTDQPISYTIYYQTNINTKSQRGPFSFNHFSYERLIQKPFSLLWIADFDFNIHKSNNNYGEICFSKLTKYYKDNMSKIPAVIGGGDYAYDLESDLGQNGLKFMRYTEGLFSTLPFLPIAGNHESNFPARDFKYFNAYYRTPHYIGNNNRNERFTSTFGRLLLVGFNLNYYEKNYNDKYKNQGFKYFLEFHKEAYNDHLAWIKKTLDDLKGTYDWLIIFSHMNMFCSDPDSVECLENPVQFQSLQDLMVEYKVDIYLAGHIHGYERVHPQYKNQQRFTENDKCNLKSCSIYDNPTAPVNVIDGSGGTAYYFNGIAEPYKKPTQYSVASDQDSGFAVISINEENELVFEHYRARDMEKVDNFKIVKDIPKQTSKEISTQNDNIDKGLLAGIIVIGLFLVILIVYTITLSKKIALSYKKVQQKEVKMYEMNGTQNELGRLQNV